VGDRVPRVRTGEGEVNDPKLVAVREARLASIGPRPPWYRPLARHRWRRRRAEVMAMDVTFAAAILREYYSPASVAAVAERGAPHLVLVRKDSQA
jgi:hypothetical protein